MGLAEDLKALKELRDKGELSETAYAAARDAAVGKQSQSPQSAQTAAPPVKPLLSTPTRVFLGIVIVLVGLGMFLKIYNKAGTGQSINILRQPQTITDEVENVPAASWKALNYSFPMGGKLEITARVVNGNPIDIFLTPADQVAAMKNRDWSNVKTYNDFNATKTKDYHRTAQLGPGSYCLVFRDTSLGILSAHATDVSVKTILTP